LVQPTDAQRMDYVWLSDVFSLARSIGNIYNEMYLLVFRWATRDDV